MVGYPTGGESLSVTQGVVSRIDLVERLDVNQRFRFSELLEHQIIKLLDLCLECVNKRKRLSVAHNFAWSFMLYSC